MQTTRCESPGGKPRRRRRLRRRRRRGACRESSNTFSRECSCSTHNYTHARKCNMSRIFALVPRAPQARSPQESLAYSVRFVPSHTRARSEVKRSISFRTWSLQPFYEALETKKTEANALRPTAATAVIAVDATRGRYGIHLAERRPESPSSQQAPGGGCALADLQPRRHRRRASRDPVCSRRRGTA